MKKYSVLVLDSEETHEIAVFGWYNDTSCNDAGEIEVPDNYPYAYWNKNQSYFDAAYVALDKIISMYKWRNISLLHNEYLYAYVRTENGEIHKCHVSLYTAYKRAQEALPKTGSEYDRT